MWTSNFWRQTGERAVKSAAQALVLLWSADAAFNIFSVNAGEAAGLAAGAAALSILTSLLTSGVGQPGDPSALKKTAA